MAEDHLPSIGHCCSKHCSVVPNTEQRGPNSLYRTCTAPSLSFKASGQDARGRGNSQNRLELPPPSKKPIHAEKQSWGIHSCVNACGACIRTCAKLGKYFRGIAFCIFANFLGEILSAQMHSAPVFPPPRGGANTGKNPYVLVLCRGVSLSLMGSQDF